MATPPKRKGRRSRPFLAASIITDETLPVSANSRAPSNLPDCDRSEVSTAKEGPSFDNVYRSYRSRIYWLCLRMVRNPADAEELTQDTFLRAFQKRQQFQGRAAFSTWLHRVATNVVLMWLRKGPHREAALDEVLNPEANADPFSNRRIVCGEIPQEETERILLQAAIGSLSARYRKVLLLHDVEGYRHREIAKLTGWSVSASKANLYRAHLRLRKLLTPGNGRPQARRGSLAGSSATGI